MKIVPIQSFSLQLGIVWLSRNQTPALLELLTFSSHGTGAPREAREGGGESQTVGSTVFEMFVDLLRVSFLAKAILIKT